MGAVRRIVVGVHGSLGSLQALRWAADEAQERQVPLVPVIAWVPPGGDLAERSHPSPYLRQVWQEAAVKRLTEAFDECLGGTPRRPAGAGPGGARRRRGRCSSTSPTSRATCS